ncbi:DUF262 domain-containing protein [Symbiobacterium thermophilum]|uniref:DUF262 domain-containing protein n=1 Tax=Symbiobacterium thermophilum TaxID=2734 RepID=UPI0005BC4E4E|nr:DUF262 domain-containing protein [Symbiobacterium thermophilum]
MKISIILSHIDTGHIALPEFQRGYVWNRDQVHGLFDSLCRRHPIGGLLVWVTEAKSAVHRGDGPPGLRRPQAPTGRPSARHIWSVGRRVGD